MAGYQQDRVFTDYIHKNISLPKIYPILCWKEEYIEPEELNELDINNGIDAIFLDENSNRKTLQYRYRDNFYTSNRDVTLRYQRPLNTNADRHNSEFFKIEADFFLYGISNGKKFPDKLHTNTLLSKWAVLNISKLLYFIENGSIVIDSTLGGYQCRLKDGKMYCPVLNNKDGSSNFVPFDIPIMIDLFGNEIVIHQKGFK